MDIVRAGITTYGMYPSDEVEKDKVPLKPAMELISHVAHVKWLTGGKAGKLWRNLYHNTSDKGGDDPGRIRRRVSKKSVQ